MNSAHFVTKRKGNKQFPITISISLHDRLELETLLKMLWKATQNDPMEKQRVKHFEIQATECEITQSLTENILWPLEDLLEEM